jgi:hypothetical protein
MLLLVSIAFSVLISVAVFIVLLWVRTPHYQLQPAQVIELLEWMILGQASENDWRVFCGYPIRHNELLEQVRQSCIEIDEHYYIGDTRAGHLLNRQGLERLGEVLDSLKQALLRQD